MGASVLHSSCSCGMLGDLSKNLILGGGGGGFYKLLDRHCSNYLFEFLVIANFSVKFVYGCRGKSIYFSKYKPVDY